MFILADSGSAFSFGKTNELRTLKYACAALRLAASQLVGTSSYNAYYDSEIPKDMF